MKQNLMKRVGRRDSLGRLDKRIYELLKHGCKYATPLSMLTHWTALAFCATVGVDARKATPVDVWLFLARRYGWRTGWLELGLINALRYVIRHLG